MSEETDRTKELVEQADGLAQRSRSLRLRVKQLAKKAAKLRRASKKVREDLDRNGGNHNDPTQ
jgi:hypothetical protein